MRTALSLLIAATFAINASAQVAPQTEQLNVEKLNLNLKAETESLRREAFSRMGGGIACALLGTTLMAMSGAGPGDIASDAPSHEKRAFAASGGALLGAGVLLTASMSFPLVKAKKLSKRK